jgi:hypothetical protein
LVFLTFLPERELDWQQGGEFTREKAGAAATGCIEQPSDRSGKAVVKCNDDLRDLFRP